MELGFELGRGLVPPHAALREEGPEEPIYGFCRRCGGELYDEEVRLCEDCLEEARGDGAVLDYMEAWPRRLLAFLREQADEEYALALIEAFRDFAVGKDRNGPDLDRWLVEG